MQLTFLGTGTSQGVPVIGCGCHVCQSSDPRNHRTRTSALLHANGQHILIDAGPDFRMQALRANIQQLDAVILTHSHFDHVAGIDDLRPLTERRGAMPIYGSPTTLHDVRHRFSYAFVEDSQGSTRPALTLQPVTAPFSIGPVVLTPFDVMHGTWTITGYRVGKLAYITDASALPPASLALLENLDVLVINALRYTPHPTHFSLDEALAVIRELHPARTFLVHTTHAFEYASTNKKLPPGVELAYDGLQVVVQ
jgi:phosphoribosyl 1,2-cyclic phosphate phosphodiesterase